MSIATAPAKTPIRHRFTVDEYYRMAEAGILPEEENVELLDGHSRRRLGVPTPRAFVA